MRVAFLRTPLNPVVCNTTNSASLFTRTMVASIAMERLEFVADHELSSVAMASHHRSSDVDTSSSGPLVSAESCIIDATALVITTIVFSSGLRLRCHWPAHQ